MDPSSQILDFPLAAVQAVNSGRIPIAQPYHLVDAAAGPLKCAIENLHDHSHIEWQPCNRFSGNCPKCRLFIRS